MTASKLKVLEEEVLTTDTASGEEEIVLARNEPDELDAMFAELEAEAKAGTPNVDEAPVLEAPLEATVGEVVQEVPVLEAAPEVKMDAELDLESAHDEISEADLVAVGNEIDLKDVREAAMIEMEEMGAEPLSDESTLVTAPVLSAETIALVNEATDSKSKGHKRISAVGGTSKSASLRTALGSRALDYTLFTNSELMGSDTDIQARSEANLVMIDKLPIKVGEKAVNLISCLSHSASLSNYTRMALAILIKEGELSSKTLKEAYLARPYSEGTANSQTTQLMKLLPSMGIALRAGGRLVKNPESTLLPMLEGMFAKSA